MLIKRFLSIPSLLVILVAAYILQVYINNLTSRNQLDAFNVNTRSPFQYSNPLVEGNNQSSMSNQLSHLALDDETLKVHIRQLLQDKQFRQAQTSLLEVAAEAVENGNQSRLTSLMMLLGEVASAEQELEMAEVYLMEALDIAILAGDDRATALGYQQLGRLHIKSREIARTASNAYDDLWLIRRQIQQGQYRDVAHNLQQVIDVNLAIRRYGAAASAYETMADYYLGFHDDYLSLQAASEAAKLYASSGRLERSREILAAFNPDQIDSAQISVINDEINQLFQQYLQDVEQSAQARQYQMLYHHYLNQGETQRAWNLRILASKSSAKVSTRLMYQRQADVMAILYNSNFAMEKARDYLQQASHLFATQGDEAMYADTQWMTTLIY